MAEQRNHTRASQCEGKIGFESAALAHEVNRRRSVRRPNRRRPPRDVYRCRHCGKWHLGG